MNPERREVTGKQISAFVDTVISRGRTFFEAYLGFEDVTRAEIAHLEAAIKLSEEQRLVGGSMVEDQKPLAKAIAVEKETAYKLKVKRDMFGQHRSFNKDLGVAYYDVKQVLTNITGVSTILESGPGFGGLVEVFDAIRQDYRVPLVELALEVDRDSQKKEGFEYLKKLKEIDQRHKYEEPEWHNSGKSCTEMQIVLGEASGKGLLKTINELDSELGGVVQKSGAIGPFREQFIIESIENILDPKLKQERDIRAGKAIARNK